MQAKGIIEQEGHERRPMDNRIFHELFVLELANNHLGRLERGLRIVHDFGRVVRHNGVRAAIKLQVRDVESFIHPAFRDRTLTFVT